MTPFWLDVIKALIGTLIGALLAFGANFWFQHFQRRRDQLAAGNVATLTLLHQLGDVRTVKRMIAAEMEERKDLPLWARIRPMAATVDATSKYDYASIIYLTDIEPTLFADLAVGWLRHQNLAYLMDQHREAAREIQRRAEESKIQLMDDPALKAAIGKELTARQEGFVEAILELCQRSEPEYLTTAERLYCALRRKFGETYYGQKVNILHAAPPPAAAVAVDA